MHPLDRRRFLAMTATGLLAPAFLPTRRAVGGAGGARRLLVFFTPNGTIHEHWRPQGSGESFSFPAGSVLEPLADHASDLIVMDGLDFLDADNHEGGMAAMLTANGPTSIDQHVAHAIGDDTPLRSIELGVQTSMWGGTVDTRMSYLDGAYVPPDDDPTSAFGRLFGAADEALVDKRTRLLEVVGADLADLHARVGVTERNKLDVHTAAFDDMKRALQGGGSCAAPVAPSYLSIYDNDLFPDLATAQIDLAVQALACGITRVASVMLSHTVGEPVFSWLGVHDGHHTLSHMDDGNVSGVDDFVACERWFAEQFAYLLAQLAAEEDPETGGRLLDSTVVLWAKEMGDGRMHTCTDVPWILAGNAGGFFTTGRYLSLGGTPHDAVLTSICQAMGLSDTHFGNGTQGPLEVLR